MYEINFFRGLSEQLFFTGPATKKREGLELFLMLGEKNQKNVATKLKGGG